MGLYGVYGPLWGSVGSMGLDGFSVGCMGLYMESMGLCGVFMGFVGLSGALWGSMGFMGSPRGLNGVLWDSWGLYGIYGFSMGLRAFWGRFEAVLGPFRGSRAPSQATEGGTSLSAALPLVAGGTPRHPIGRPGRGGSRRVGPPPPHGTPAALHKMAAGARRAGSRSPPEPIWYGGKRKGGLQLPASPARGRAGGSLRWRPRAVHAGSGSPALRPPPF